MTHFVYQSDPEDKGRVHPGLEPEYRALQALGASVGLSAIPEAERLVLRASVGYCQRHYPEDKRYLHNLNTYRHYAYLSHYYPVIEDLTIETFFVDALGEAVDEGMRARGWDRAFIKNDMFALSHLAPSLSIYPDTSFEEMMSYFREEACFAAEGRYAIRRLLNPEALVGDERYFVFGDSIYHQSGNIPDIVREGAERLRGLGGKYFIIDATPELIIEVNPGESSDRHAVNPPEVFARWLCEGLG